MQNPVYRNHLKEIDLFNDLTSQELDLVLQSAQKKQAQDGAFFFMQGDPADTLYVLISGRVKLIQIAADGQQVLLRMIGPWSLFAVIAIVKNTHYPISAQAAEDCEVLAWSKFALMDLTRQIPQLAMNSMKFLADRVHEYQDRVRELSTERVERRLARALLRLAVQSGVKTVDGVLIGLPLSRQDLAEMTGTTLFTVSRILSQWESINIVSTGREKVVIKFPHGLVRIADDLPPFPPEESTLD